MMTTEGQACQQLLRAVAVAHSGSLHSLPYNTPATPDRASELRVEARVGGDFQKVDALGEVGQAVHLAEGDLRPVPLRVCDADGTLVEARLTHPHPPGPARQITQLSGTEDQMQYNLSVPLLV